MLWIHFQINDSGSIVRRKIKYDMKASSAITLKLTLLSEVAILLKTISRGINWRCTSKSNRQRNDKMNLNTSQQFHSIVLNDKSYSRYLLFTMAKITAISTPILAIDNQPELSLTFWSKSNAQYNTYIKAMGKCQITSSQIKNYPESYCKQGKIIYILRE